MWEDEIINEIRKYRNEHASQFNYDSEAIFHDLKAMEQTSTHKKVSLKPKRTYAKTGTLNT